MRGSRARALRHAAPLGGYRWLKRRWVRTPRADRPALLEVATDEWFSSWSREVQARWREAHPRQPRAPRGFWNAMRELFERAKLKHTYDR